MGCTVVLCATYIALPFLGRVPIPVPTSAKWVRFSEFGFWKAYDLQVRFSAPCDDCIKAAEDILVQHGAGKSGNRPALRIEIKNGRYVVSKNDDFLPDLHGIQEGNKWWFRPDKIRNGVFFYAGGGLSPHIWIDTDRKVFLYKVTD
jgi:hypothetical protein